MEDNASEIYVELAGGRGPHVFMLWICGNMSGWDCACASIYNM